MATVIEPENAALLSRAAAEEEKRFFLALDDGLRRVVAFYGDRSARCKREAASHASQLRHLRRTARRRARVEAEATRGGPREGHRDGVAEQLVSARPERRERDRDGAESFIDDASVRWRRFKTCVSGALFARREGAAC